MCTQRGVLLTRSCRAIRCVKAALQRASCQQPRPQAARAAPGKAFQGGRLSIWEPQKGAGGSREKAPELPAGVVGLGTMQPAPVRAQWYFLALFFLASCLVLRRGISL